MNTPDHARARLAVALYYLGVAERPIYIHRVRGGISGRKLSFTGVLAEVTVSNDTLAKSMATLTK